MPQCMHIHYTLYSIHCFKYQPNPSTLASPQHSYTHTNIISFIHPHAFLYMPLYSALPVPLLTCLCYPPPSHAIKIPTTQNTCYLRKKTALAIIMSKKTGYTLHKHSTRTHTHLFWLTYIHTYTQLYMNCLSA